MDGYAGAIIGEMLAGMEVICSSVLKNLLLNFVVVPESSENPRSCKFENNDSLNLVRRGRKPLSRLQFANPDDWSDSEWVSQSQENIVTSCWWEPWKQDNWINVVAMDIESVQILECITGERKQKAATISVVNYHDDKAKEWKVYHKPGSFVINWITRQVNGFEANDFVDGAPFEIVKEEVVKYLKDKLIILCSAKEDFDKIDCDQYKFEVFDIQDHWYTETVNAQGVEVREKLSLASIYRHYYPDEDFQENQHTSLSDARATLRLFKEQYINSKIDSTFSKFGSTPFKNIVKYTPQWKKGVKQRKKKLTVP